MTSRLEKLEGMLAAEPQDTMVRYMLALEVEKTDDHDRSLELLNSLMSNDPAYVPAFLMAGQQLARLGRISEARETYRNGIQQAQQQNDDHAAGEMGQFMAELSDDDQ